MDESKSRIPVRHVIPVDQLVGEDEVETALLLDMAKDAEKYLSSFSWCRSVVQRYFGAGIGGVVGVFLFHIQPSNRNVDEWLWVVIGAVPPAYRVTDDCNSPSDALAGYIQEMHKWVELARIGKTSADVIPVNVPATPEGADQLQKRLDFLTENILPQFREDELTRADSSGPE